MSFKTEPYVRYIAKSTYFLDEEVVCRDCRLAYFISGEGNFEIQGNRYSISKNTLIFYPFGIPYHLTCKKGSELLFYTVNFDFSNEFSQIPVMVPKPIKEFKYGSELKTEKSIFEGRFEEFLYFENAVWAESLFEAIYNEEQNGLFQYKELQSTILKNILINICRKKDFLIRENSLCQKIKDIISKNISLNNKKIANILNYHPYYLNAVFKDSEGVTLHEYILKQRLIKAHALLTETTLSLGEISIICGFCSQSHLSVKFKEMYNLTPSEIRKRW